MEEKIEDIVKIVVKSVHSNWVAGLENMVPGDDYWEEDFNYLLEQVKKDVEEKLKQIIYY